MDPSSLAILLCQCNHLNYHCRLLLMYQMLSRLVLVGIFWYYLYAESQVPGCLTLLEFVQQFPQEPHKQMLCPLAPHMEPRKQVLFLAWCLVLCPLVLW